MRGIAAETARTGPRVAGTAGGEGVVVGGSEVVLLIAGAFVLADVVFNGGGLAGCGAVVGFRGGGLWVLGVVLAFMVRDFFAAVWVFWMDGWGFLEGG